ncbi:DUF393 domain-containing protein [bacterium]|nr:DUF393 domain-containing protein [bacterium]
MAGKPRKPTGPVIVYDGSCGICEALKSFAASHLAQGMQLQFIAHQDPDLAKYAPGVKVEHAQEKVIVLLEDGTQLEGATGVAWVMKKMTDPWAQVGHILAVGPITQLAQPVYRMVARYRSRLSRLFGLTACPFPAE